MTGDDDWTTSLHGGITAARSIPGTGDAAQVQANMAGEIADAKAAYADLERAATKVGTAPIRGLLTLEDTDPVARDGSCQFAGDPPHDRRRTADP